MALGPETPTLFLFLLSFFPFHTLTHLISHYSYLFKAILTHSLIYSLIHSLLLLIWWYPHSLTFTHSLTCSLLSYSNPCFPPTFFSSSPSPSLPLAFILFKLSPFSPHSYSLVCSYISSEKKGSSSVQWPWELSVFWSVQVIRLPWFHSLNMSFLANFPLCKLLYFPPLVHLNRIFHII